ncbi:MAG: hypothetical protein JSR17_02700 [Proteobacteria bacterium]|nr:hypothetical protein [Pseudomonadota bacterium]
MAHSFDPAPLQAFFEEAKEQLGIELKYLSDNPKFPIQLASAPEGLSRNKCVELLQFIKTQVDLRDNEIGELYASKTGHGKYVLDIRMECAKALADVYALSTFYPHEEEEPTPVRQPKKHKKSEEPGHAKQRKGGKADSDEDEED